MFRVKSQSERKQKGAKPDEDETKATRFNAGAVSFGYWFHCRNTFHERHR